jgi:hypothetical protein
MFGSIDTLLHIFLFYTLLPISQSPLPVQFFLCLAIISYPLLMSERPSESFHTPHRLLLLLLLLLLPLLLAVYSFFLLLSSIFFVRLRSFVPYYFLCYYYYFPSIDIRLDELILLSGCVYLYIYVRYTYNSMDRWMGNPTEECRFFAWFHSGLLSLPRARPFPNTFYILLGCLLMMFLFGVFLVSLGGYKCVHVTRARRTPCVLAYSLACARYKIHTQPTHTKLVMMFFTGFNHNFLLGVCVINKFSKNNNYYTCTYLYTSSACVCSPRET